MIIKNISPLRYPGGKTQLYDFIKEMIILNKTPIYIEAYAGGMGVALKLLLNNEVQEIIVNDYDKGIYAFWFSVLNYPEQLIKKIETTPITIDEWRKQREIQKNKEDIDDLLELGFSTLFLNRTNRSGIIKAGVIGGLKQNGNYKMDCRFNKDKIIEKIKLIASMKDKIKLYNMDAEDFISLIASKMENAFTFFDPPYYSKGSGLYTLFYKHDEHQNLANAIEKYMKKKQWILTYDIEEKILNLYSNYNFDIYYLNYSVLKPTKGMEYMFYSQCLKINKNTKNLKILSK